MNKAQVQEMIDLKKWYDSEESGRDMCGTYAFCAYCNKNESFPCATAYEKANAATVKTTYHYPLSPRTKSTVKPKRPAIDTSLGKKFDYDKVIAKKAERKPLSFAEKYALSSDILKERYAKLKAALTETKRGEPKIKSRISRQCDTYRRKGKTVAKITIIGRSLRINLPLDPDDPEFNDGRTPHINMGHKRVYEDVPFQFKVNSTLGLRRALALIKLVK